MHTTWKYETEGADVISLDLVVKAGDAPSLSRSLIIPINQWVSKAHFLDDWRFILSMENGEQGRYFSRADLTTNEQAPTIFRHCSVQRMTAPSKSIQCRIFAASLAKRSSFVSSSGHESSAVQLSCLACLDWLRRSNDLRRFVHGSLIRIKIWSQIKWNHDIA